ncbi:Bax inhibitor-1/YccA family protein, partial [Pseudoclavibacter soli]
MALDNPVLSNNAYFNGKAPAVGETATAQQLRDLYDRPAAAEPVQAQPAAAGQQTRPLADSADRLTYDGVIVKSFTLFGVLIAGAVIGWMIPALLVPGMIVGLVLGLVNSFKKQPSVPLILLYGAAEGVFIGAISGVFESIYPGVVVQAVIATFSVFGVTLALFASGKVRASARGAKILMIAMVGYMVFSLINVGMMLFG